MTLVRTPIPRPRALSVTELTQQIKALLEHELAHVWVEGELSGLRPSAPGHLYFTLKDAGAQLPCAMWASYARLLRFRPADGQKVLVKGRIEVYAPHGKYQLIAESIEPRGAGELQLAFEQLKARLAAEGLFDPARKRPLPRSPRRVGIVTSAEGAALRDVVSVFRRRWPMVELVISPSRVQGAGAADEVVTALGRLVRLGQVDVILVTRGGGSLEDLWTFNEEKVARALASCPIPTVSAVGHEVDFTIADFVADLRAPTPSAAAELLSRDQREVLGKIVEWERRARNATERLIAAGWERLEGAGRRLKGQDPRRRLTEQQARLEQAQQRLGRAMLHQLTRRRAHIEQLALRMERHSPQLRVERSRLHLATLGGRLRAAQARLMEGRRARVAALASTLGALSPLAVLGRGYALATLTAGGQILRGAAQVQVGDTIHVRLGRGALSAEVTEVVLAEPSQGGTHGT